MYILQNHNILQKLAYHLTYSIYQNEYNWGRDKKNSYCQKKGAVGKSKHTMRKLL
jgi:hypothetical protein